MAKIKRKIKSLTSSPKNRHLKTNESNLHSAYYPHQFRPRLRPPVGEKIMNIMYLQHTQQSRKHNHNDSRRRRRLSMVSARARAAAKKYEYPFIGDVRLSF